MALLVDKSVIEIIRGWGQYECDNGLANSALTGDAPNVGGNAGGLC